MANQVSTVLMNRAIMVLSILRHMNLKRNRKRTRFKHLLSEPMMPSWIFINRLIGFFICKKLDSKP